MFRFAAIVACAALVLACSETATPEKAPDDDGQIEPPPTCPDDEIELPDSSCLRAGIDPAACAEGFAPEAGGCVPILPQAPCEDATIALPGDESCRPIADCGGGEWGLIDTSGVTVFVSASAPAGGDGSEAAPLSTISAAVAAAPAGATVAVAEGDYSGPILLGDKPLTVWGRCPGLVSVSTGPTRVEVSGASEATFRGFALSGTGNGVIVRNNAILRDLWIHDLNGIAIAVQTMTATPAVAAIDNVHIARAVDVGVLVLASQVTASDIVIRDMAKTPGGRFGRAWDIELGSVVNVDRAVVERVHEYGVYLSGASATMSRVVVRDVLHNTDVDPGRGFTARSNDAGARSALHLSDVFVERTVGSAVHYSGSDGVIARLYVRDTAPRPSGFFGYGLSIIRSAEGGRCDVQLDGALFERLHSAAIVVSGSSLTANSVWIRDVVESQAVGFFGRGVAAQSQIAGGDTTLTLTASRIERVRDIGVATFDAVAHLERIAVLGVQADINGDYGDGVDLFGGLQPAHGTLVSSLIRDSARAGIANFASNVTVRANELTCNRFDLNGEDGTSADATYIDEGGNNCGCGEIREPCKAVSARLSPPEASSTVE